MNVVNFDMINNELSKEQIKQYQLLTIKKLISIPMI